MGKTLSGPASNRLQSKESFPFFLLPAPQLGLWLGKGCVSHHTSVPAWYTEN